MRAQGHPREQGQTPQAGTHQARTTPGEGWSLQAKDGMMLSHQQEERRGQAVSCCTGASLAPTCSHQPSAPQPSQLTSPLNHPSAHQSSKLWDTQCLLALPWAEPQHPKPPGERGNGGLGGKLTRKYQGPQGHTVTFLPLSFYFFLTNPNQGKWVGGQRERERQKTCKKFKSPYL